MKNTDPTDSIDLTQRQRPSALLSAPRTKHQYVHRLLEVLEEIVIDTVSIDTNSSLRGALAIVEHLEAQRPVSRPDLRQTSLELRAILATAIEAQQISNALRACVLDFTRCWRDHIAHDEREEESQAIPSTQAEHPERWGTRNSDDITRILEYLRERVIYVGGAGSSLNPVRAASTVVEKLEIVAGGFKDLQQALSNNSVRMLKRHHTLLKQLVDQSRSSTYAEIMGAWVQATWTDMFSICASSSTSFLTTGRLLLASPRRSVAHVTKGRHQARLGAANTRDHARSTRADALNLLMRVFLKQTVKRSTLATLNRFVVPGIELLSTGLPAHIKSRDADFPSLKAEWILSAERSSRRVLLYLPGGGFVFPATRQHRLFVSRLATSLQARCLLTHYRLAPAHKHSAALADCVHAYDHLIEQGIDPACIIVAGDSAGGGLALSMMMALRDANKPLPAAAILLSPLADLTYSGASRADNRWRDPMLATSRVVDLNAILLEDTPPAHPSISPIFGDYAGFPPMLAQVGGDEILLDDTLRMAAQARSQAVRVDVEVWRELPHVWHLIDALPESALAIAHIEAFVSRHVPVLSGEASGINNA